MAKLGLIDWGIGGIGVYREIKRISPQAAIFYFSDTGALPYGKMHRRDLARRLDTVIEHLANSGVTDVVIACNAASTAIDDLRPSAIRVSGVIEPAIKMALAAQPQRLGLIGGRRTILSGAYRKAFQQKGVHFRQRIAQPLSAMIEAGDLRSAAFRSSCEKILRPLYDSSHILLACTHYPAAADMISACVSPDTVLLDPAGEVAASAAQLDLDRGSDIFQTTGDAEAMKRSAIAAFSVEIKRAESVVL